MFKDQRFETITLVMSQLVQLRNNINERINEQITLTRKEALSPKTLHYILIFYWKLKTY